MQAQNGTINAPKRKTLTYEDIDTKFNEILTSLAGLKSTKNMSAKDINKIMGNVKVVRNTVKRLGKKKRQSTGRICVFNIPVPISGELADFFNLEHGTKMSRTECTKRFHKYIIEKNLQNPENRREIRPDIAFANLFNYKKSQGPMYYKTLQALMQRHFIKEIPEKVSYIKDIQPEKEPEKTVKKNTKKI